MDPKEIEGLITAGLPDARVRVRSPDNTHFEAVVIAADFAGLGRIARHRLIHEALGTLVGNEIHALSIRAFTPDEWSAIAAIEQPQADRP